MGPNSAREPAFVRQVRPSSPFVSACPAINLSSHDTNAGLDSIQSEYSIPQMFYVSYFDLILTLLSDIISSIFASLSVGSCSDFIISIHPPIYPVITMHYAATLDPYAWKHLHTCFSYTSSNLKDSMQKVNSVL